MKELTRKIIPDDYEYKYKNKIEKRTRWRVFFEYVHQNGEIKRTKPSFKTKKKAEKKLADLIKEEVENGRHIAVKDQVLLRVYAEDYKKEILDRLSPTSHINELSRVNEAVSFFYHKTISSITRRDIKSYKSHLKKKIAKNAKKINGESPKLSDASVHKYLTRLRHLLNEAGRDYKLPVVDFTGDIMPKKKKGRSKIISFWDFDRLLNACTGKQEFLKLRAIALWETGARPSELFGNEKNQEFLPGLKRRDIDFEKKRIRLWNSKLHPGAEPAQRECYLSSFFQKALIEAGVHKLNPDELVFKFGDFRASWQKVLSTAGIDPEFWQKDVRHCFITYSEIAGVPQAAIRHQINHAGDNLMERTYINVKEEALTELFARFEAYSELQRKKVEDNKTAQKANGNTVVVSTPSDPWDFSFLPTFRDEPPGYSPSA